MERKKTELSSCKKGDCLCHNCFCRRCEKYVLTLIKTLRARMRKAKLKIWLFFDRSKRSHKCVIAIVQMSKWQVTKLTKTTAVTLLQRSKNPGMIRQFILLIELVLAVASHEWLNNSKCVFSSSSIISLASKYRGLGQWP